MDRADFEQWKPREVARLLALVETERRYYQEIVANIPVSLVIVGAELSVVSANRQFRVNLGKKNDEILGRQLEELVSMDPACGSNPNPSAKFQSYQLMNQGALERDGRYAALFNSQRGVRIIRCCEC